MKNDKCEIHDVITDGDNVEITATVCVSNNMSEAVQFEVSGYVRCYYKGYMSVLRSLVQESNSDIITIKKRLRYRSLFLLHMTQ